MKKPPQPKWTGSGIVDAPVEQVWEALLDVQSSVDWRSLTFENGTLCFITTIGDPPIGRMHVEIDKPHHRLALQGEWWYRGEWSVEPHERGSFLVSRVYNIAPRATRWMVPLIQRQFDARMKGSLQGLLVTLGDRLDCPTLLVTSESPGIG